MKFSFVLLGTLYFLNDCSADQEEKGRVIGIDLGTTYSCVGVYNNGAVSIIPNEEGNNITPSYVAFTPKGRLIGDLAKNQLTSNPTNTIFNTKLLIGRKWNDTAVQQSIKYLPYKVVDWDSKLGISVSTTLGDKIFAPEEISAMILGKMKEIAETYLHEKVTHAVITVPAYFTDAQRRATKDAAEIAGLKVLRMINEATAAVMAYGLHKKNYGKNVIVIDLGGGTVDVSLLALDKGVFEVVATKGNTHIGGEKFNQLVIQYFIELFKDKTGKDVSQDKLAIQKLSREVERAKHALSSLETVEIQIESFFEGKDLIENLTRAKFEKLNRNLFESLLTYIEQVLRDAYMTKRDIDEIVLVGGSTRIPKVRTLIKEFFNGKEVYHDINTVEAIAYGATVHAGVLSWERELDKIVLLDVNPLTLGTCTESGEIAVIFPRNSLIPNEISKSFITIEDDQTSMLIDVYEGEHFLCEYNNLLDSFELDGIKPAPKGTTTVLITYKVSYDGILRVSATVNQGTRNTKEIVITNKANRLTRSEIKKMKEIAGQFAEEDGRFKEQIEAKSNFERAAYSLKKKFQAKDGRLSEKERREMLEIIDRKIQWLDEHDNLDAEEYRKQERNLNRAVKFILKLNEEGGSKTHIKDEF